AGRDRVVARRISSVRPVRGNATGDTAAIGSGRAGLATNAPHAEEQGAQAAHPLVIIVAYEAESHLPELIGRLARVEGIKERWSVLLLDDASRDRTSDRAKELFAEHGFARWR